MKTYIVQVYSDERCGDTWAAYSNKDPEELEDAIIASDEWLDIEADHISNWAYDYEDEDDEWVDLIAPHAERWPPDSWFRTLPIIWDERK